MKKILFSVLLISCFPASLFAACEPELCNTSKGDDKIGVESLSLIDRGAGNSKCFICEEGYCADGDVVGDLNTEKFRVCKHGFNDKWEVYTPKACKDIYDQVNAMQHIKGTYKVYRLNGTEYRAETGGMGSKVVIGGQEVCYFYKCPDGTTPDLDKAACVDDTVASNNTGTACTNTGGTWTGSACICVSSKNLKQNSNKTACECTNNSYEYVSAQKKCVAKGGNGGGSGGNNGGQGETSNCRNRPTPEGRACCDLPTDVAKWDDPNCNCLDDGKEFKIVNGKGQCVVAESNDGTPFVCTQNDLSLFNQWAISCASHAATMNLITQIKNLCASGNATAKRYNDLYVKLTASVAINCQQTVVIEKEVIIPDNSQARAAIISAGGVLDSIVAGFGKANVWKNAQGEFNTARLASDSIAAVVLGTAGGLITSSVMKKHQVEDGFEDLKCVIGGQPVAGWGDEFRVGIQ